MGDDNRQPNAVIGPLGQPVLPTIAVTSPSSSTTTVKPTAGYMQSIQQQKSAFDDERAAVNEQARVDSEIAAQQKLVYDDELINQQAKMQARADLAQQHQRRIEEERARREDFIQRATAEPSSYWADRTEGERTMSRIGVWLSAFGSAVTGGDNLAIKRINENIERDIKVKQARAEKLLRLAEMSRGLVSDAYREKAQELADADAQRIAGWDMAKKMAESIKMGFLPAERRAEADAKIAKIDQEKSQAWQNAEEKIADKVVSDSGHVSVTIPLGEKGNNQVDSSTKQAVIIARETAKSMNDLGDFIRKNPTAWNEYQKAAQAEAELEASKQGNEKLISSLQGIGVAKVSIDQRLKTPEARKINAMLAPMITAKAREMDPIGALNKDAYINASRSLNIFTGPPNEIADKAYEYGDKNNRIADEYVRMTPALQKQAPPPRTTGKTAGRAQPPASDPAGDYSFIVQRVSKLDPQRRAAFDEAVGEMKKPNGDKAKAAKVFRYLRDELPKD